MKVLTAVGARPQFIKAAAFSRAVREQHQEVLVHTGQHYDPGLSDVFFQELELPQPHHHLGVGSGSHGQQTGQMLARLESLERAQPVRQRQFERLVWLLCNQAPTQDQAGTDQWKRRVLDVLTSMDYPEERREQMRQLGDPGE